MCVYVYAYICMCISIYIYTLIYIHIRIAMYFMLIHTLVLEAWVLSSEHLLPVVQGAELSEAHWTEPF